MRVGDEQLAWLASALERAKERGVAIIALMHRPLWRYRQVEWETRVQPLLERAGVDAVIAGHFHSMQRVPDVGGVQYHILGTCGGMIDQPPLAGWQLNGAHPGTFTHPPTRSAPSGTTAVITTCAKTIFDPPFISGRTSTSTAPSIDGPPVVSQPEVGVDSGEPATSSSAPDASSTVTLALNSG